MQTDLISIKEYCVHNSVEPTFIESLEESGIIALIVEDECKYIHEQDLAKLDRCRILHFELHINIEGIDAIEHLLQRQADLLAEIEVLRNTLRLYA